MHAPTVRIAGNAWSRRRFLHGAGALAAAKLLTSPRGVRAQRFERDPFTLGVASGYPLPNSLVLWTRLAPQPLMPGGGMPAEVVPVQWEIARDEAMREVVQSGVAYATPQWAHALHVEVFGLEPARWYWYRFRSGDAQSAVGRTRTAPNPGVQLSRFRFAYASCQQYEQGFFSAYRHMLDDELDLIVHLGDYIYESSWGTNLVRKHEGPEPHSLDDYRARFALYRIDPDLQAAHAACPWLVTWDDHELENDYANDRSEENDTPEWFLQRRAAAYQAYYEHMPLRRRMLPFGSHMRLYARAAFGNLVEFQVLDDRQYRSYHPCPSPGRAGGNRIDASCVERLDPSATLLGEVQERWLEANLSRSKARWNVIAQQTMMAQFDRRSEPGAQVWNDGWDGYPAARQRLLEFLHSRKTANPVVIGGDVHSFWVTDLKLDFDRPESTTVATEFVGTSVSSQAWPQKDNEVLMPFNPHVRFGHSDYRGYTRMEVTEKTLTTDLRALRDVSDAKTACDTLATFVVADGKVGAQRA